MKKALIVDVETTGLKYTDEVIELAALLFEYDENTGAVGYILETYVGFREPSIRISSAAQQVHGITSEMVKGQKLDDQRIQDLLEQADFLIAHNAKFDKRFVAGLYPLAENKLWRCSMDQIDWFVKGHSSKGLQQIAGDLSITIQDSHRALADCQTVYQLLSIENHFQELIQSSDFSASAGLPTRTAPAGEIIGLSTSGEDLYPVQVEGEQSYFKNLEEIAGYYDEEEGYEDFYHKAFLFIQENPRDPEHPVIVKIDDMPVGYLKTSNAKTYLKRLAALGAPANAVGFCYARISGGKIKGNFKTSFGVRLDFSLKDFEIEPYPKPEKAKAPAPVESPAPAAASVPAPKTWAPPAPLNLIPKKIYPAPEHPIPAPKEKPKTFPQEPYKYIRQRIRTG